MSEKTTEWCPECENEVELDAEMKVQTCPSCGLAILPCSICDTRPCSKCPLEK